jgi:hypothetical protein
MGLIIPRDGFGTLFRCLLLVAPGFAGECE